MAFGNKNKDYVIDLDKKNYKDLLLFKGDRFMNGFTHAGWALLYNTFFGLGGMMVVKVYGTDNFHGAANILDSIGTYGLTIACGIGHGVALLGQGLMLGVGRKPKIDKHVKSEGNHLIRKRKMGIVFIVLGLLPAFVWLIGRIVILFMCKDFLARNGSYDRPQNKFLKEIELKQVDKNVYKEVTNGVVESIIKGVKNQ